MVRIWYDKNPSVKGPGSLPKQFSIAFYMPLDPRYTKIRALHTMANHLQRLGGKLSGRRIDSFLAVEGGIIVNHIESFPGLNTGK